MRQTKQFSQSVTKPFSSEIRAAGTGPDRGVLLAATELFTKRVRHDLEEKRIFLELAYNLLPATSPSDRRKISAHLAGHPETPQDLLQQLAGDADELTAYPALRYGPALSVDLLVRTASEGPDALRKAIANRPSLRESVIDALCEHAGADVIRLLLDRDDIILTRSHQAKLSCRSDIIADLGLELAEQEALSADGLMGQFLHLPDALKSRAIATAEMISLVKQAQASGTRRARQPDTGRQRVRDALVRNALFRNKPRFADLLSQGLGLPLPTCELLLREDQADGLTVALKALDMSSAQVSTVLIRLVDGLTLVRLRNLLRLRRTLSNGAAEVLVGQWTLQDLAAGTAQPKHEVQYQETDRREHPSVPLPESAPVRKTAGT